MIQYIENTNLAYCDGYKFRKDKKSGYWLCSTLHKRLHRYIYEKYNGKIPEGMQVHHIDHNKDNNEISNLMLLTRKEHDRIHFEEMTEEEKERRRKNLKENAMPKAKEWHKSDEGKEWHKKHYQETKNKLHINQKHRCLNCNKEYESTGVNSKFCSNVCKSQYRRKTGLDNIEKICDNCGKKYISNKYSKTRYCSKSCSKQASWKKKGQ